MNSTRSASEPALRLVRAVVTGLVLLVGLATLVGVLDRVWWVFELADVFRLQYLAVLVVSAVAALALRRPRLAVMAATLALVNVAVLGISLTPTATASDEPALGSLRLVVANVEVGNTDFAAVGRLVTRTHPDVFGVTELTPEMARHLASELPQYHARVLATRSDAYGIGIFSRVPLRSAQIVHLPADGGPPTAVASLRVADRPLTFVVTHVHTPFAGSIHVRQLQALAEARPNLGDRVVVCGDFNTPPWSGPLRDFAGDAGLRDLYGRHAWRGYSWPTWSSLLRVPLDNCFLSGGVRVRAYRDGPNVGSDHRPLVVDLGVTKQ
jgi:endonuclease/exonuclease/phosphatase (EEP) superfamily protein YafD